MKQLFVKLNFSDMIGVSRARRRRLENVVLHFQSINRGRYGKQIDTRGFKTTNGLIQIL
jgi:hypothetical protein